LRSSFKVKSILGALLVLSSLACADESLAAVPFSGVLDQGSASGLVLPGVNTDRPVGRTAQEPRRPFLGLLLDVGVPEGAEVSLLFRPWYWLRFHGGLMNNAVSTGIQGGVSLIPFYSWFTPALTVEAGHFFADDANGIVRRFSSKPNFNNPLLKHVGYDFGNAHLGLEIGSPRVVSFFLRGGLSYIRGNVSGVEEAIGGRVEADDLKVRGVVPSAKLGLMMYFL